MTHAPPAQGVVYCSYGRSYLDDTIVSIRTLRQHNPGVHVCVLTDEERSLVNDTECR